jgi:TP901 family phage tail tape measure protein
MNKKSQVEFVLSATDKYSREFGKLEVSLKTISKVSATAATGAAVAINVLAVKSLEAFKGYQSALTDMGKVTSRSLSDISAEVMGLDASLGDSTELMRGYYQVISAGVKGASNQIDNLTASSKLAKAAHVDQAETIKAVTKVMAGYEGEIKSATSATDLLLAIEKQGQTQVSELVPVIGELASVSHLLNINTSELGGAFAQITQTAGNTAQAATQYRGILDALIKPTADMAALLKKMGYESGEAAIKQLGFVGVLKKVDEATGGSTVKLGKLISSQEGLKGFTAVAANGFQNVSDKITEVGKATGETDAAFKRYEKTIEGASAKLNATMNKGLIELGEKLAPAASKAVDGMTTAVESLVANDRAVAALGKTVIFTAEAVLGLGYAVTGAAEVAVKGFGLIEKAYDNTVGRIFKNDSQVVPESMGEGLGAIRDSLGQLMVDLDNVSEGLDDYKSKAKAAGDTTKNFADAAKDLNSAGTTTTAVISQQADKILLWGKAWANLPTIVKKSKEAAAEAAKAVKESTKGAVGDLSTMVDEAVKWTGEGLATLQRMQMENLIFEQQMWLNHYEVMGSALQEELYPAMIKIKSQLDDNLSAYERGDYAIQKMTSSVDGLAGSLDNMAGAAGNATKATTDFTGWPVTSWTNVAPSNGTVSDINFGSFPESWSSSPIGVYAEGTDYVPRTGPAILHKGEAVLTADENRNRGGITLSPTININGANKDGKVLAKEIDAEMAALYRSGRSQLRVAMKSA